ncbi:MAG: hypothetical protein HFE73_02120 [Firmicutes bacterium]|nr:hypothetical protein [Bacillota bacterium]
MKKTFCNVTVLLLILALCACKESGTSVTSLPAFDSLPEQNSPQATTNCIFDPDLFDGKIQNCAYAGEGKLFVVADKLYLYDTATAAILASTESPLRYFDVQIIDGGYILSGMGDDGMMAYFYDHSLSLNREIEINELLGEDFVISETGVASSADGKKLVITAMGGLYLYDLESESLTTLLDLTQNLGTSTIGISMVNGAVFAQDNSQIIFYGRGNSIPAVDGEKGFSIYGSVAVDGSNLKITKPSAYDIEEMQSSASRLFFPQIFTQADGSLLWMDRTTGGAHTLSYTENREGRDGVYSSEQGKYVATAVLDGNLTVRVYDVDSGKQIATKVIENSNTTYFNRIPSIYLLDETETAVVLLGGSISEVDTLVSTFTFGE